jgi:PAS domain S-box-containing protein
MTQEITEDRRKLLVELAQLEKRTHYLEQERDAALAQVRQLNAACRQGEDALRESEGRFRLLAEAMPQFVWIARPDGTAEYVNARWIEFTGLDLQGTKRLGWPGFLHPDDLPRAKKIWDLAVASGSPAETEVRYRAAEGSYRWFLSRVAPVRDDGGTVIRWIVTFMDIHPRRLAEEELTSAKEAAEAASRAKSEFLANMSHEIRTPMTVFMTALEYLLQIDQDGERRQVLEMANKAAERLRALIEDILDFSRIEAGRVEIQDIPFNVRVWLGNAVDMLTYSALEKGLRLAMEVGHSVPPIVAGDPDRLEQVLANLIGNAIKFTEGGEVKVSIEACDGMLRFAVADSGIGVPEAKRDAIFQSFTQVDGSLTRQFGGTGLGLAICKGLVERMGGAIGMHPQKGGGSIFFFTHPLKAAEAQHPALRSDREAGGATTRQVRILLAEDDPAVQEVLRLTLGQRDWQTEVAANGCEAVEKWKEGGFDLILMDLHMPEMDGLEATRRIREAEKEQTSHTCIIGLTADVRCNIRKRCLEAGMDDCLTKPVRIADLYLAIERALADDRSLEGLEARR